MLIEFYFTPELHLKDGRIIRDLEEAASFAREQEVRPGVDQRDEVLHKVERAENQEAAHAAAYLFVPRMTMSSSASIGRPAAAFYWTDTTSSAMLLNSAPFLQRYIEWQRE